MASPVSPSALRHSSDSDSHVTVVIRLRPPQEEDEDISEVFDVHSADNTITIRDPLSRGRSEQKYAFNHIFLPQHGQQYVFESVAMPLIDRLLDGFNSCCFAYGQTGSGKTHSIFGAGSADQRGVLARAIEYLFERIERRASHKEVGMVVSFTEIYLDQVRDLGRFYKQKKDGKLDETVKLDTTTSGVKDVNDGYLSQDLTIHESPQGIVYVEGLAVVPVSTIREVLDVVNLGVRMRQTYETRLNATSSRSHTIFTVSIVQKSRTSEDIVNSVTNFVDLAGSERIARSKSEGKRFQEAVIINSSLSALGKVVLALASDAKAVRHVPYRDSKLTRILQNSLGGNSFTTLLTTIDPTAVNYEESLNSLSFADRCKNVQNRPVHGHIDGQGESQEQLIHRLNSELATLRTQLESLTTFKDVGGIANAPGGASGAGQTGARDASGAETTTISSITDQTRLPSQSDVTQAGAVDQSRGSEVNQRSRSHLSEDEAGSRSGASSAGGEDEEDDGLKRIQQQAEQRLRHERELTKQAERRADEAMARLEQARLEQQMREDRRRQEACDVRRKNKELEVEIAKCKSSIAHIASSIAREQDSELQVLQRNTSDIVQSREDLLRSVPLGLSDELTDEQIEATIDRRNAGKDAWADEQRSQNVLALQGSHVRDVGALQTQYGQWFQDRDMERQRICSETETCRSKHQRWLRQMRGQMLEAHGVVQQLTKVIEGFQAGVPSQVKSEIRPPALQLGGLRARLKDGHLPDRVFDQFSKGTIELCRKLAKYEQILQKVGSSDCSSEADWAENFARDFCDFKDGASTLDASGADATLQRLDATRLRALCMSLRKRVRMTAAEQEAERGQLRTEVAKDLAAHDRVDEIRQLEKDIADYKVKLCYEEDQVRHLEVAAQSCARSASKGSSRSHSRLPSRPASRPASAGPGRAITAGGAAHCRTFSAGPRRR